MNNVSAYVRVSFENYVPSILQEQKQEQISTKPEMLDEKLRKQSFKMTIPRNSFDIRCVYLQRTRSSTDLFFASLCELL